MEATAPIFIVDGLDISAYRTAAAAALHFEGPDVLANDYRVYDAKGHRFVLHSSGGPKDYSAKVKAQLADEPAVPQELAQALRASLEAQGLTIPPRSSLADLVWSFLAKVGYER